MDHGVGGGEVQSEAACLERDQKDVGLARLEGRDALLARLRRGRAVEQQRAKPVLAQARRQQLEEAAELAEHQHLVPVLAQVGEELQQVGRLRRSGLRAWIDQARVAAELAHPGQRRQQHEAQILPVALGRGLGLRDLLEHRPAQLVVQRHLLVGQAHAPHDLGARGQLGRDVRLRAPQDERPQQRRQRAPPAVVAELLDRHGEPAAELLPGAEQAGTDDAHEAPDLAQVVLDGRAGQPHAPGRAQPAQRARTLGGGVLHRLRLVEHQRPEFDLPEAIGVERRDRVARDQQIAGAQAAQLGRAVGPAIEADAQRWREARRLVDPVADHRRGRHHQRGAERRAVDQHRQRLQGLAEPHLVGEDRARAPARQAREPLHAGALIRAQRRLELGADARDDRRARGDAAAERAERSGGVDLRLFLDEPHQRIARQPRNVQRPRRAGRAPFAHVEDRRLGARQRLAQGLLDAHEAARADRHVATSLADRRQQVGERHHLLAAHALDARAALDGEPIPPVGHLHAQIAPPDRAVVVEPRVVGPLDDDRRLGIVGQILERRDDVQRRIAGADAPAPGRGLGAVDVGPGSLVIGLCAAGGRRLLRRRGPIDPAGAEPAFARPAGDQPQSLGERPPGALLSRAIAAYTVAFAPLPFEQQRRPLAGSKDRAQLGRPHAEAHLERARGQELEPRDRARVGGADRTRPVRRQLHVDALLQRLEPRRQRIVRLGRKRHRRQRQGAHHRGRLCADLGQQDARSARLRLSARVVGPMQDDDVPVVAKHRRHFGRKQRDADQLQLRRQAPVARGREAQPEPPLADVQPAGAAPAGAAGAVEEHRGMIDERAQHAEDLRRRERATPGLRAAGEAVVIGAKRALVDGGARRMVGQLVPGQPCARREYAAAPALLHHRLHAQRALAQPGHAKGDPLLGTHGGGAGRALRLDPRQPLVERAQRELPDRHAHDIDQRVALVREARIADEVDHRLQRRQPARRVHLAASRLVALPAYPAQRPVGPPQQDDADVVGPAGRGRGPVDQRSLVVAQRRHRRAGDANARGLIRPRGTDRRARVEQLRAIGAQALEQRRQRLVVGIAPLLVEEGAHRARPCHQHRHAMEKRARRLHGGAVGAPQRVRRVVLEQELPVAQRLAVARGQERPRRAVAGQHQVVQVLANRERVGPREQLVGRLGGRWDLVGGGSGHAATIEPRP